LKPSTLLSPLLLLAAFACGEAPDATNSPGGTPDVTQDQPAAPAIDTDADSIFKAMGDFLSAQRQFQVGGLRIEEAVTEDGQKLQFCAETSIQIRRPDSLHAVLAFGSSALETWCSGKELAMYHSGDNVVARAEVPGDVDGMMDFLAEKHSIQIAMLDLLVSDPYGSAMGHVESATYVGASIVHGRLCHQLAFRSGGVDWQIWIDIDGPPVPRRLVLTFPKEPSSPQVIMTDLLWHFPSVMPDSSFHPSPPADATAEPFDVFARRIAPAKPAPGERAIEGK